MARSVMLWVLAVQVFVFLLSNVCGQVQIRFQQRHYTFPESTKVCVEVEHVGGPAPNGFSFSYSFDAVLIGQQFQQEFTGTKYFRGGFTSTEVCLSPGSRDNQVCESDTIGTIRLINSSAVRVMEPYIATVTITDDELFASFSQTSYTFLEGSGTQQIPLVINNNLESSITFHLTPAPPLLNQSTSLSLESTDLLYQPGTQTAAISVSLKSDDLALEEPEVMSLGVILSSAQCYDLTITPTEIVILDSSVVGLDFVERQLMVLENEGGVSVCVSISSVIARPLQFVLIHDSTSAVNTHKGGSIFGQFPALSNISERCFTIPVLVDDIIETDEQLTLQLDIDEKSYPSGVLLPNPTATVTIVDTSTCYMVTVKNSSDELFEVPAFSSVCFHCQFKEDNDKDDQVAWRVGALVLKSGVGEVLSNGTLQVTNSSSVFRMDKKVMLSCSHGGEGGGYTFPVALKGANVISSMTGMSSSSRSSASSLDSYFTLTMTTLLYSLIHYCVTSL